MSDTEGHVTEPEQLSLRRDIVEWPLANFRVPKMGAFGAVRKSDKDGWCPYKNGRKQDIVPEQEAALRKGDFPCTHYGADLAAPAGSKVYAPHDGWILYAGPANKPPFIGYTPGVVLLAHNDVADSLWSKLTRPIWKFFDENDVAARYSLLAHILPVDFGFYPAEGEPPIPLPASIWDSIHENKKMNDDWWRRMPKPYDDEIVMRSGALKAPLGSAEWLVNSKRWVNAGDHIGDVGDGPRFAPHVHWEIRTSPLAGREGRSDPIAMWRNTYNKALPDGALVAPAPPPKPSGGGAALLLLLLALASEQKRPRLGHRP